MRPRAGLAERSLSRGRRWKAEEVNGGLAGAFEDVDAELEVQDEAAVQTGRHHARPSATATGSRYAPLHQPNTRQSRNKQHLNAQRETATVTPGTPARRPPHLGTAAAHQIKPARITPPPAWPPQTATPAIGMLSHRISEMQYQLIFPLPYQVDGKNPRKKHMKHRLRQARDVQLAPVRRARPPPIAAREAWILRTVAQHRVQEPPAPSSAPNVTG